MTKLVVLNGIAWQLYHVKYAHRKELPAERVVGLRIAAGNVALHVFWRKFVTFVGEGDFDTGADRIVGQVLMSRQRRRHKLDSRLRGNDGLQLQEQLRRGVILSSTGDSEKISNFPLAEWDSKGRSY